MRAGNMGASSVTSLVITNYRGGGGYAGISAIQIPSEVLIRNLFGVFQELCRYTLGSASAHCFS